VCDQSWGAAYRELPLTLTATISQECLKLTIAVRELAQEPKSLAMVRGERGTAKFIMRNQCLHCEVSIIASELLQLFRDRLIGASLRQMSAPLSVRK
jgi:hypothetical protein